MVDKGYNMRGGVLKTLFRRCVKRLICGKSDKKNYVALYRTLWIEDIILFSFTDLDENIYKKL